MDLTILRGGRWSRYGAAEHILVHGDCADGHTSAGLLLRQHPDAHVHYTHPTHLARLMRRLARRRRVGRVVIADLSPQAKDLDAVHIAMRRLTQHAVVAWIDHHAPQWPPEFERGLRDLGVDVLLDRTGKDSGASLSARWTEEKDPALLRLADLIRRRDAWTDPHDLEARAWTLVATDAQDYVARVAEANLGGLEAEGKRLLMLEEERLSAVASQITRPVPEVGLLWGEDDISDVADRLFQRDGSAVFLIRVGPSARASVRTRKGRPLAAPLAQRFGGGGHENAAGFDLGLGWWARRRLRRQRLNHPAVARILSEAAAIQGTRKPPGPGAR